MQNEPNFYWLNCQAALTKMLSQKVESGLNVDWSIQRRNLNHVKGGAFVGRSWYFMEWIETKLITWIKQVFKRKSTTLKSQSVLELTYNSYNPKSDHFCRRWNGSQSE
jgi:hypothetical protein